MVAVSTVRSKLILRYTTRRSDKWKGVCAAHAPINPCLGSFSRIRTRANLVNPLTISRWNTGEPARNVSTTDAPSVRFSSSILRYSSALLQCWYLFGETGETVDVPRRHEPRRLPHGMWRYRVSLIVYYATGKASY